MLNAVAKSSCLNVRVIKNKNKEEIKFKKKNKKKVNSIPVVKDGTIR